MREDIVHVAVRKYLRLQGWQLIAGEYPNGSDDDLAALCILNPVVACDNSPDPRRHALDKIVPDLVCNKENVILLIEMKASYSALDEKKLEELLLCRRDDLLVALAAFTVVKRIKIPKLPDITFVPCLGFSADSKYPRNSDFCYFKVYGLDLVTFLGNKILPSLS